MPLGKLKRETVLQGYRVLQQLADLVSQPTPALPIPPRTIPSHTLQRNSTSSRPAPLHPSRAPFFLHRWCVRVSVCLSV